jgi:hypothetical protein
MNRTLVETVCSMLSDSKLPQKFWAEALSTAVYLRNRSPAKSSEEQAFEAWTSHKPTVGHLRMFERKGKVKKALAQKFDIKDLGHLHHFLGMNIVRHEAAGKVWVGKQAYTESVLQKFGMDTANSVATPVDAVKRQWMKNVTNYRQYQSAIGWNQA